MANLKLVKSLWGVDDHLMKVENWPKLFKKIKDEGFSAIEAISMFIRQDPARLVAELQAAGLKLIVQLHCTGGSTHSDGTYYVMSSRSVADHIASFTSLVEEAVKLVGPVLVLINSHSGHDSWGVDEAVTFLKTALEVESRVGVPITHETHRIRMFWNPYITRDVLKQPGMEHVKVNADLSHFVVVCERAFNMEPKVFGVDDWWPEVLALIASRCWLIHTRVGYGEGPQVPDPRAPEYAAVVQTHLDWWGEIWDSMRARGLENCWCEPEFGPAPYLHHLPYTDVPVADLWDVNAYIANRVTESYNKRYS